MKNFGTKLNTEIRQKLRSLGVSTVEIKSTRISDKYKQKNNFTSYDDENSLKRLISYLNTLDFISYPYFTRYGNMNFEKYCYFAKEKLKIDLDDI